MQTWGVDLSTTASSTGVVSISWLASDRATFQCHRDLTRTRSGLVEAIARTASQDWWAVDVPFGWPNGWGEFLQRHSQGPAELPNSAENVARPWQAVARRVTDLEVVGRTFADGRKRTPGFSVSFDKLGATAAAWAWVEFELERSHGIVIDRSGMSDTVRVCETYPAAAWRKWFTSDNPSSAGTDNFREALAAVLEPADGDWTLSGHERDALVCAVVARARALKATQGPSRAQEQPAKREGWIHLQRDGVSIAALAEST
jgi:Protein of unknown function (DUF429)